jgi:hypothetical protein
MEQTWLGRIKAKERREARREAQLETLQQAILVRFPAAPPALAEQVEQIQTVKALENLLTRVIQAESLEDVERLL